MPSPQHSLPSSEESQPTGPFWHEELPLGSPEQAKHGNGNGHGASLSIEALRLLPTPRGEARNIRP
jgi:hypothetical protein